MEDRVRTIDQKPKFTDWLSLNTLSTQCKVYANAKCLWFYQTTLVLEYVRNKLFTTSNLHIRSGLLGWSLCITVQSALGARLATPTVFNYSTRSVSCRKQRPPPPPCADTYRLLVLAWLQTALSSHHVFIHTYAISKPIAQTQTNSAFARQ